MDVSIIIPTMNRPEMLLRLIRYFDALEYQGKILIGDSSSADIFNESASAIVDFQGRLDIVHCHLPGLSIAAAVLGMNTRLTTSYVCLIPDDDFIVPSTVGRCIQFLDEHLDYVAAHGQGVLISSTSGESRAIDVAGFYRQTVIEDALASTRLIKHLECYTVNLFSIHRAEIWRKMFIDPLTPAHCPPCSDSSFRDELLPCCLSVVYGKIKQVEGLYLVRQVHDGRYLLPSWFSWVTNINWNPSYRHFRSCVANAVSSVEGISVPAAENVVDAAFSAYLRRTIAKGGARVNLLRKFARNYRILKFFWRILNKVRCVIDPSDRFNIDCLLSRSSPYHEDFLPVYTAVTQLNTAASLANK